MVQQRTVFRIGILGAALAMMGSAFASAAPSKKIVLIAGPITGHPKDTHEYEKSVILLKHLLDTSNVKDALRTEAHFRGWPTDPKTLDDADTIVFITDGSDRKEADHPLYVGDRPKVIARQMRRGCGLVAFHWSTFHPSRFDEQAIDWLGGYFDYEGGGQAGGPAKWFSRIATWEAMTTLPRPQHPIALGVHPFRATEEYYYNIRFRRDDRRIVPVVATRPQGASADEVVGWAVERADTGRGFSFTGGHFFRNWWNADFRKLILNAIVWTAKAEVPSGGVAAPLDRPIRAWIVTGYNHPAHDWRAVTAALLPVLEQDPRMIVEVTENVEDLAGERLRQFDLVVFNYSNWDRPGLSEKAKQNFIDYLKAGGGLAVIHFANGAFTDTLPNKESDWPEFRTQVVRRIWVHGEGKSGHDAFGPFRVDVTPAAHPITGGLEPFETVDELYFRQYGALPIEPLATARSKVTGQAEPLAFAYAYGKGRVFQTMLGHADVSIRLAGALMRRGSVWAAGRPPLSFDPPVSLTKDYRFRDNSPWTPQQSRTKGEPKPAASALPAPAGPLVAGRFGQALDARRASAHVAGRPEWGSGPFTVECWARLGDKRRFNILVAHETKASATHWEIFTFAGTGRFTAYLPGMRPDHVHSNADVCDGRWHHLAFVFEPNRGRLYVDGKPVADQRLEFQNGKPVPGNLSIGSLAERTIGCDGIVDEVRISKGVREIGAVPAEPLPPDGPTLALWRLDAVDNQLLRDESKLGNHARLHETAQASADQPPPPDPDHWGERAIGVRWTEADSIDDRWQKMDTGPFFSGTIATPGGITPKGLVVRLGDDRRASIVYDTELLCSPAGWLGFLEINPARYGLINPQKASGPMVFTAPAAPGWSSEGSFADPRPPARTSEPGSAARSAYGPLPRAWGRYNGLYLHGNRVVMSYTIGGTEIKESPWLESVGPVTAISRTLEVGRHAKPLELLVCSGDSRAALVPATAPARLVDCPLPGVKATGAGRDSAGPPVVLLALPPCERAVRLKLLIAPKDADRIGMSELVRASPPPEDLHALAQPGRPLWTAPLVTKGVVASGTDAYVVDTLTLPTDNPYRALLFTSGHDFFRNGDAAVCTVHGDVWRVSGIDERLERLVWKRFATGLFQPLGLKIVNDVVHVVGRDQITILHDRNEDGAADQYQNFNNDGQVTANAHEYVACLETDRAGNFYYLKGDSGSRTTHDGCLLQVAPSGEKLEVFATGFRNAIGLSIGPDEEITVAPQEGEWTPGSAIFQVQRGGFYGAMQSHHRPTPPDRYDLPICWIPRRWDNSSGGQVWVAGDRWGLPAGSLLHLSFGACKMMLVLRETVAGRTQAAVVNFPFQFDSGAMRGRFRPQDGQLYVTGLKGWASRAVQDGCLHRVRYTGRPLRLPVGFGTMQNGITLRFAIPLDRAEAQDPDNFQVEAWNLRWSARYGSPEYKLTDPKAEGRDEVPVRSATLLPDGKSVFLEIDPLPTANQMVVTYTLADAAGTPLNDALALTVHRPGPDKMPKESLAPPSIKRLLSEEQTRRLEPGLVLRLDRGDASDVRVSRLAALAVARGSAPSPFLEPGRFRASFRGYLQIPLRDRYTFRLVGRGAAQLRINGAAVLAGDGDLTTVSPAALSLRRGFAEIELAYESPSEGDAVLRLYWKTESFPDEPIPPAVWHHAPAETRLAEAARRRQGRELYGTYFCGKCHDGPGGGATVELLRTAPDLAHAGARFAPSWLAAWIADPRSHRPDARMPRLFADPTSPQSRHAIADLTAYLADLGKQTAVTANGNGARSSDAARGEILYEDLGCVACHHLTAGDDAFGRVSLALVKEKFAPGALEAYLAQPHRFDRWSRMPDFRLNGAEVAALTAYLRGAAQGQLPEAPWAAGDPARGKTLFRSIGCAQCHAIESAAPESIRAIRPAPRSVAAGCLAESARGPAPFFGLSAAERAALVEFLKTDRQSLVRDSSAEAATRLVGQLRCIACHNLDRRQSGRAEVLAEESSQGTPPELFPDLTFVGEKLKTRWLSEFLGGRRTERPRPWLKARMPAYPAYARWLAEGLAADHGFLPDEPATALDQSLVSLGQKLVVKGTGFDCRECHGLGTAIDFLQVHQRLRPEYYDRFMLDPYRYNSRAKMPKFAEDGRTTKVKDILAGDASRQFQAIWHLLAALDPDPPTASGK